MLISEKIVSYEDSLKCLFFIRGDSGLSQDLINIQKKINKTQEDIYESKKQLDDNTNEIKLKKEEYDTLSQKICHINKKIEKIKFVTNK